MFEKISGESLDITKENIEKLKKLFPEVVSEGKVDVDKLKDIFLKADPDEIAQDERYNFTWSGKRKSLHVAQQPSKGTLLPIKEKSKNWDTTKNLYIEGDNLEVLKLLQKSYFQKIKLIYIDPPYNTGRDFVYKDNYKDGIENYLMQTGQVDSNGIKLSTNSESNGRYHSDWLNMIYPRLKLARNLLMDDGVIFVSIDDNEVYNIRKIMNELFGEQNFISQLIWRLPRGINAGKISKAHEYIIIYAKDIQRLDNFNYVEDNEYIIDRTNKRIDGRHPASIIHFPKGSVRFDGDSAIFEGEIQGNEKMIIHGTLQFKNGLLDSDVDIEAGWTNKRMIQDFLDGKDVYDTKGQKIEEFFFKSNGRLYSKKVKSTVVIKTIPEGLPDNQDAKEEMVEIFGEDAFSFPKPSKLLKWMFSLVLKNGDTVVDFFSGSGTTAHAGFEVASEGVNVKSILIQLPENLDESLFTATGDAKTTIEQTIKVLDKLNKPHLLTELAEERIRRAGEKIKKELIKRKEKEGMLSESMNPDDLDIGFKVFKLERSNIKEWDADFEHIGDQLDWFKDNIVEGRSEEDIVYEIMLKSGLDLNYPIEKISFHGKNIFKIAYGALFICLDDQVTVDTANKLIELKNELKPEKTRIVFKDLGFKDDQTKINVYETLKVNGFDELMSI